MKKQTPTFGGGSFIIWNQIQISMFKEIKAQGVEVNM